MADVCGHAVPGPAWCLLCYPGTTQREHEQDRVASLPAAHVAQILDLVARSTEVVEGLRRLVGEPNWREPAAPEATAPRPAAAEAPADSVAARTSPLATRVLTALMDMPDAEFLTMANKVLNRYYAAVQGLAPDPSVVRVECMYCHKVQTHRVCADCFAAQGKS